MNKITIWNIQLNKKIKLKQKKNKQTKKKAFIKINNGDVIINDSMVLYNIIFIKILKEK